MTPAKKPETQVIHTRIAKSAINENTPPIFLTSGYAFDSAEDIQACFAGETNSHAYSRYQNPNTDEFIDRICVLEDLPHGIATASGMAAIFATIMAVCNQGDHIVSGNSLFGSTYQLLNTLLPRWGISTTFVNPTDNVAWQHAIQDNTKMVLVETPSNPGLILTDLAEIGVIAKQHNIAYCVDNCFASPIIQNPAKYGADIIIHSATKLLDGHGRCIGGVVVTSEQYINPLMQILRLTGPTMSAMNAWLLSRSIETLAIRVRQQSKSALRLAKHLQQQPTITSVSYPMLATHPQHDIAQRQMKFGGSLVTFTIDGGTPACQRLLNRLQLLTISANLGDSRTIATHPTTTTHAKLTPQQRCDQGICDGLIRISVGLEHWQDIAEDIVQALVDI